VIQIQKGAVQEIGIANAAVTHGRRMQLRFLRALGTQPTG
jgi:hypothetical protein